MLREINPLRANFATFYSQFSLNQWKLIARIRLLFCSTLFSHFHSNNYNFKKFKKNESVYELFMNCCFLMD